MTTRTLSRAAAPTPGAASATLVVAPEAPLDAVRSWRRLIRHVDPAARGSYALNGPNLTPGLAYEVPDGALIVAVDKRPDRFTVRLLRAAEHELAEEKTWHLKGALGKRVVDYIGRRLAPDAPAHQARRRETIPNRWTSRCRTCGQAVNPGEGIVLPRTHTETTTAVTHQPGACPPPPEVITPNRRSEPCLLCGRWVAAGTGVARRRDRYDETTRSWYQASHDGPCPPDAPAGPVNRRPGWCTDCGHAVPPGHGWRDPAQDGWPLHHQDGACPPAAPYPTWIVRRARREPAMQPGQVRRVRVDLRGRPDNTPVPADVPGFRVLRDTYVELAAVVLEAVPAGRSQQARVRAATPDEAAGLLAGELAGEASRELPRPEPGCKADWAAERIADHRPWLAEITGRHPDYEYERIFQPFRADYSQANSRGTRGVVLHWTLTPGHVYETEYPLSRRELRREFLRATPDGDVVRMTREEVETWLNTAAAWIAR